MILQVSSLVIVRVIDFNLEHFLLLKVEVHENLLDPLWTQIIVDDLGSIDLLPHVALLLEQNDKWIGQ